MGSLWQDIRFAARVLWKSRGFTAVAVLTLALGIGANTAIFSVVNAVLLRPLPYEKPERLMLLQNAYPFYNFNSEQEPVLPPVTDWLNWREYARSFESIAAYGAFSAGVNLTGAGEPERIEVTEVTGNFFNTVGVKPVLGRTFLPDEEKPGQNHVAVISHGLWQRRFGTDEKVLGQTVWFDGKAFTVVGVAPPGLRYPSKVEAWLPIAQGSDRVINSSVIYYQVIGRLAPDATVEQARTEMAVFSERLKEQFPNRQSGTRPIEVVPLAQQLVKDIRPALLILLGAVALVLLISCVNVANLLLARAASRRKELAVRAALGASRWRIARQLFVESVLLALLGGSGGLLLAMWGIDSLLAFSPAALPRFDEIRLDGQVLVFTLLVSLLTGLLFGLLPALQGSQIDLNEALKEGGWRSPLGRGFRRSRGVLVVAETALALMLMVGAGLLINSFVRLRSVDPGFDAENTLTLTLSLPSAKYDNAAKCNAFFEQLLERLGGLPGVQAVGATNALPLSDAGLFALTFKAEGSTQPANFEDTFASFLVVTPDYFKSMGIQVAQGRPFNAQDAEGATPVVIVNEELARRYWPNESPIGKRLSSPLDKSTREIVGVVKTVKSQGLAADTSQEMFLPYRQVALTPSMLTLRAGANTAGLVSAVRSEVKALDPDLPLYDIKMMEERLADSVAKQRFTLVLFGVFAATALLLAAVGMFGVMNYAVTQRTHEIGVRMALGARRLDTLKLILRQGLILTLVGVAIGLAGALALTRLMSGMLYGLSATDPLTFAGVSALLTAVALLACLIPARRATKVDPMVALRYE